MEDFKVVLPTTTKEWQRDMNIAYNQALEDFSKKMKQVNLTNSFELYFLGEIDLEEFMNMASDEIQEQLMK